MKANYSHETFAPGFDPHGNHTKIEREEDLEINGVTLRTSKALHADEAGDETYALPADKGVVVEVIPDDHLPIDTEGNKAEIVILPYLAADYEGVTLMPRPRQLTRSKNHQRQGYSRRKAKRHAALNYGYKVKHTKLAFIFTGRINSSSKCVMNDQIIGRMWRTELAHPEGKQDGLE